MPCEPGQRCAARHDHAGTQQIARVVDLDFDDEVRRARRDAVEHADDRAGHRLARQVRRRKPHARCVADADDLACRAVEHRVDAIGLLQREDLPRTRELARVEVAVDDDAADRRDDARLRDLHAHLLRLRERRLLVGARRRDLRTLQAGAHATVRLHLRHVVLQRDLRGAHVLLIVLDGRRLLIVLRLRDVALLEQQRVALQRELVVRQRLLRRAYRRASRVDGVAVLRDRQPGLIVRLLRFRVVAAGGGDVRGELRLQVRRVELRQQLSGDDVVALLHVHGVGRLDQARGDRDVLKGCDGAGKVADGRDRAEGRLHDGDDGVRGRARRSAAAAPASGGGEHRERETYDRPAAQDS